ncbi:hypothetical protein LXL04_023957 [Taraxacum kok-saghyz]
MDFRQLSQKVTIPLNVVGVLPGWLHCSLVGEMKDLELVEKCMSVIKAYGLGECDIKYMGGLNVLLVFNSKAVADCFLNNQKVNWFAWFSWLRKWDTTFTQSSRVVWIKITGVPAGFWNSAVFSAIAELFGKVLIPFDCHGESRNISFGKVCLISPGLEVIEAQQVEVKLGDACFNVIVKEDGEWQPLDWAATGDCESDSDDEEFMEQGYEDDIRSDEGEFGNENRGDEGGSTGKNTDPGMGSEFPQATGFGVELGDDDVVSVSNELRDAPVNTHADVPETEDGAHATDTHVHVSCGPNLFEGGGQTGPVVGSYLDKPGCGLTSNDSIPDLNSQPLNAEYVESTLDTTKSKDQGAGGRRILKSVRFEDKLINSVGS